MALLEAVKLSSNHKKGVPMFLNKMSRRGLIAPGKGTGGGKIAAAMSHTDRGEQASDEQANNGPGYSAPASANSGIGSMRGTGGDINRAQVSVRKGTGTRQPSDHGLRRTVSTPKQQPLAAAGGGKVGSAQARVRAGKGTQASDSDESRGPKIRGNTMRAGQTGRSLKAMKYAVTGTQIPDSMEEGMGGVIRAAKGGHVKAPFGGRVGSVPAISVRPYPAVRPPMARPPRPPMPGMGAPGPGATGMRPNIARPAGGFRPMMAKGGRVPASMGRIAALDAKLDKKLGESEAGEKAERKQAAGR